jgi:GSH-dependent disulfide-bond oxidoreductase
MIDLPEYTPPKVWSWSKENGGRFANINRPIAGPTHDKELPVGRHPLQLYSLATPNGVKVTVMLEELLALGHRGAEYDAWLIKIDGNQFGSRFVAVNPNSKIPALMDRSGPAPIRVFESGSILLHLAEKFGAFLPTDVAKRAECLSWLFWQMGSAPYLGGGFGHFYAYAPTKIEYAIDRFAMEVKRQLDVLDRRLADNAYVAGDDYSIADIAIWPWYGGLAKGVLYGAGEFLGVQEYKNVQRWADAVAARPAVRRGRMVNRTWGESSSQLHERHDASDFETRRKTRLRMAKRRPEHNGRRRDRYQIGAPCGRGARHHASSESALPLARSRLRKLILGARPSYPCDLEE